VVKSTYFCEEPRFSLVHTLCLWYAWKPDIYMMHIHLCRQTYKINWSKLKKNFIFHRVLSSQIYSYTHTYTHTHRKRETERERKSEREKERQRQRQTERDTERDSNYLYLHLLSTILFLKMKLMTSCVYRKSHTRGSRPAAALCSQTPWERDLTAWSGRHSRGCRAEETTNTAHPCPHPWPKRKLYKASGFP